MPPPEFRRPEPDTPRLTPSGSFRFPEPARPAGELAPQRPLTPSVLAVLHRARSVIRTRHYSPRTEKAYLGWMRRFVLMNGGRHPAETGLPEVARFLVRLAVEHHVSASTQNQAFSRAGVSLSRRA